MLGGILADRWNAERVLIRVCPLEEILDLHCLHNVEVLIVREDIHQPGRRTNVGSSCGLCRCGVVNAVSPNKAFLTSNPNGTEQSNKSAFSHSKPLNCHSLLDLPTLGHALVGDLSMLAGEAVGVVPGMHHLNVKCKQVVRLRVPFAIT